MHDAERTERLRPIAGGLLNVKPGAARIARLLKKRPRLRRTFPRPELSQAPVQLVIVMDGLGAPAIKVRKYNLVTDSRAGHFDKPPVATEQVFGVQPVQGGLRMDARPNVLIIA